MWVVRSRPHANAACGMMVGPTIYITFRAMGKFSRRQTDDISVIFSKKIGCDTSCKLSPLHEVIMQSLSHPIF